MIIASRFTTPCWHLIALSYQLPYDTLVHRVVHEKGCLAENTVIMCNGVQKIHRVVGTIRLLPHHWLEHRGVPALYPTPNLQLQQSLPLPAACHGIWHIQCAMVGNIPMPATRPSPGQHQMTSNPCRMCTLWPARQCSSVVQAAVATIWHATTNTCGMYECCGHSIKPTCSAGKLMAWKGSWVTEGLIRYSHDRCCSLHAEGGQAGRQTDREPHWQIGHLGDHAAAAMCRCTCCHMLHSGGGAVCSCRDKTLAACTGSVTSRQAAHNHSDESTPAQVCLIAQSDCKQLLALNARAFPWCQIATACLIHNRSLYGHLLPGHREGCTRKLLCVKTIWAHLQASIHRFTRRFATFVETPAVQSWHLSNLPLGCFGPVVGHLAVPH